jgi:hypothetical protein
MLTEEQKKEFASLRVEILDLNVLTYFFVKKINRYAYLWQGKHNTREYILEELTALRYMENGIILHLTNLDDDSSEFSFRSAAISFNKASKKPKEIQAFKDTLKTYRKNLNLLKVEHRNERIAHLNYEKDLKIDEYLQFEKVLLPLIIEANTIADQLWGERINVKFRLGSLEGVLDYRKDTENFKIDIHKIQGFY